MSGQAINQLLRQLVSEERPTVQRLAQLLNAELRLSGENPFWTFYEFELAEGPFAGGRFRSSKSANQAHLSLQPAEEAPVAEGDLELGQWGSLQSIRPNPRIPPEGGADSYIYNAQGVRLSFQLTHQSRRLRTVALEWGMAPGGSA